MGSRKIRVRPAAAENIASIALYIESKGMLATAEKFSDDVYDFILRLADTRKSYHKCKEPVLPWDINASLIKRNTQLFLLNRKMN